ncbi:transcription initiation factor TFIID subunit 13 [Tanacetum coccineum]
MDQRMTLFSIDSVCPVIARDRCSCGGHCGRVHNASTRGKILTEDFLFLIRKDTPKLNRCTELLSMNEEFKQARKAFDVDEEKLASAE